jgi:tetratricopeptide (TPR) repeat protein
MKKIFLTIVSFCFVMLAKSQTAVEYLNSGVAKSNEKNYTGAIEDYSKAILVNAGYQLAYYNRGLDKSKIKDYEGALADFNKFIELDPNSAKGYALRGGIKRQMKDYAGAIADYTKAITIDPNYVKGYAGLADTKRLLKDYAGAIADYTKAITIDPNYTYGYFARALIKRLLKDNEGAIADYSKAIELDPKYVNGYMGRSFLKRRKKDYEGALADLNTAIEIDPKNAYLFAARAIVYYYMEKFTESVAENEKAISLDPNYGHSYINNLESLARLHRFSEAAGYYDTYTRLGLKTGIETDSTWAFYKKYIEAITMGAAKNNYELALKNLKEAELLFNDLKEKDDEGKNNSLTAIYEMKGYVLEKLNRLTEASDVYNQSLVIDPVQADIKRSLVAVESKLLLLAKDDTVPPAIEIINPKPSRNVDIEADNGKTQIIGRAKDASGIAAIKINGNAIENTEVDGLFITELVLKAGANEIDITATDKQGNTASKKFILTGALASRQIETNPDIALIAETPPKYYAILIAEKDYDDAAIPDLQNPVKDARELKNILQNQYTFNASDIDTLFNRSREEIMQSITQRCNTLTENDNLVIFYAGHGTAEKDKFGDVDGYWIPVSAKKGLTASYISADDINKALKRSNARHILMIADACFSGAFTRSLPQDANKSIQKQYKMTSRKIMASGNLEPVPDNSRFLFYLKNSLKENKEKYISAKDLFDSFYKAIVNNSENLPQYAAIKNVGDEGGEFVFIKK